MPSNLQPMTRTQHAIADYGFIGMAAAAPKLLAFEDDERAARISKALSSAVLGQNLMTRSEWGIVPVLPFKAHLAMDYAIGAFTVAAPWIFGFSKNRAARNTFIALGVMGLISTILTRPENLKDSSRHISLENRGKGWEEPIMSSVETAAIF